MIKFLLITLSLLLAGSLAAGPIFLCGTGMADDCKTLATYAAGATDSHYTLVAVPPSGGAINPAVVGPTYLTQGGSWPVGGAAWAENGPSSAWISPTQNPANLIQGSDFANGLYYVYQTTFDITEPFDEAVINGEWASDNAGIAILLNGHNIGSTIDYGVPGNYSYQHFTSFTISDASWFRLGTNTLQFVVSNGNGTTDILAPSGLRVQMTGATAQPEPATFGLLMFGLPLAWFVNRKRAASLSR